MLISKHDCYNILFELQSSGQDVHEDISKVMRSKDGYIPEIVISYLKNTHHPTVEFYLNLNNKAHKLIKEILDCDNKPISNYIKMATSLITQATITLEHMSPEDINSHNKLINSLRLPEVSEALNNYFSCGDYNKLVDVIHKTRLDIKAILDN